jgi:hypothetical protein
MEIQNLYDNITNNKIYLDIKDYTPQITPVTNNDNIFNDISLKHILNTTKLDKPKKLRIDNTEAPIKNEEVKKYKFITNSLLSELGSLVLLEENEIKDKIKEYVNSVSSNDYLKTLSRSYKKLRIDVNNILVKNLDSYIFNEVFYIICKVFSINLIVLNNNNKIYSDYVIDNTYDYCIFNEITNDKNKNYIFKETIKNESIPSYLNNYNKKLELSKLKQLKVDELKELCNIYNINSNQKKQDLLKDLDKFT